MSYRIKSLTIYDDRGTEYGILTFSSKTIHTFEIELGQIKEIFDYNKFESQKINDKYENLFPENKIRSITIELPKNSAFILRLRPNHILINSTLQPGHLLPELFLDNDNRLLYLFYNFKEDSVLKLNAKITKDTKGTIKEFAKNLLDNNFRERILNLRSEHEAQSNTLNNQVSTDYTIKESENAFLIKFGPDYYIEIKKLKGMQLIIFKLKNVAVKEPSEIVLKLFNEKNIPTVKAHDRCERNFRTALLEIEKLEREIRKRDRNIILFSLYVKETVKFNKQSSVINYNPISQKLNWHFELSKKYNLE